MRISLGMNEALILTVLEAGDAMSVADVAGRLSSLDIGRSIDDGSIYLALHRMSQRGMVTASKRFVTSGDGKQREINFYTMCAEGQHAVTQFLREATAATKLANGVI
jgi:DNA-binding PadR family transcriptional regulator